MDPIVTKYNIAATNKHKDCIRVKLSSFPTMLVDYNHDLSNRANHIAAVFQFCKTHNITGKVLMAKLPNGYVFIDAKAAAQELQLAGILLE